MPDLLERLRDEVRHVGEVAMGVRDPAQRPVGEAEQEGHGQDHHDSLQGVRVHHGLEPTGDHIGGGDDGKE